MSYNHEDNRPQATSPLDWIIRLFGIIVCGALLYNWLI